MASRAFTNAVPCRITWSAPRARSCGVLIGVLSTSRCSVLPWMDGSLMGVGTTAVCLCRGVYMHACIARGTIPRADWRPCFISLFIFRRWLLCPNRGFPAGPWTSRSPGSRLSSTVWCRRCRTARSLDRRSQARTQHSSSTRSRRRRSAGSRTRWVPVALVQRWFSF